MAVAGGFPSRKLCGSRLRGQAAALVAALLAAPLAVASPEEEARPAEASLEDIRDAVRTSREALRCLMIDFDIAPGPLEPKPKPGQSHHRFAARGPLRFTENRHSYDVVPPELDPDYHLGYYTGDSFILFYPRERYCEIVRRNANGPHSLKIRRPIAAECLAWWPPDDASPLPPEDPPFLLHEVLSGPECSLLPQQEQIEGHWCHVIDVPGVDRIWLDPGCGFAVRRRDRSGVGPPPRGAVRYELSDYKQISDGVWIPWRMRRAVYGRAEGAAADTVLGDVSIAVVRAAVNDDVPTSLFHFEPPAGTLISDRDTSESRQVPGGLDLLDQVLADGLAYARLRASPPSNTVAAWLEQSCGGEAGRGSAYHVSAALCALLVVAAGGLALRRSRSGAAARAGAGPGSSGPPAVGIRHHPEPGEPNVGRG